MQVCRIDPLSDPRWPEFVDNHSRGGIFHTRIWLEALRRTYGYEPVVYAGVGGDQRLSCGIPFCRIRSMVTGRRLVSLPFSDHCEPLVDNPEQLRDLVQAVKDDVSREGFRYLELRPLTKLTNDESLAESNDAVVHRLDLGRSRESIVAGFHKSCILRKIRSAPEGLTYEAGASESTLASFYRLMLLTRRKHQLPPQPLAWFRNLMQSAGKRLSIHVLSKDDEPVAAVLTFSFKNVVTYKYSCSDPRFNSLAGTVRLIWQIVQDATASGATELDLGRSDLSTPGLIQFKDHWGAVKSPLTYYRCPRVEGRSYSPAVVCAAKRVLTAIPDSMFRAVGGLLYRHVG